MSSRLRDENLVHAPLNLRKSSHANLKKSSSKENNISQARLSVQRPTLASSLKVTTKTEFKPKSRPVLAVVERLNSNATPKPKSNGDTSGIKGKPTSIIPKQPLALANRPQGLQAQSITQSKSHIQTPKTIKKVVPKSTKKAISVYTPARPTRKVVEEEVEYSHPKPAGLADGPPTPLKLVMGEPDDIGLDPMPEMGEEPVLSSALSLGLDHSVHDFGAEFDHNNDLHEQR